MKIRVGETNYDVLRVEDIPASPDGTPRLGVCSPSTGHIILATHIGSFPLSTTRQREVLLHEVAEAVLHLFGEVEPAEEKVLRRLIPSLLEVLRDDINAELRRELF